MHQAERLPACNSGYPLGLHRDARPVDASFRSCTYRKCCQAVTPAEQKALDALEKARSKEASKAAVKLVKEATKVSEKVLAIVGHGKSLAAKAEYAQLPGCIKTQLDEVLSWLEKEATEASRIVATSGMGGGNLADMKEPTCSMQSIHSTGNGFASWKQLCMESAGKPLYIQRQTLQSCNEGNFA
jgi:hypothetical protein